MRIESIWIFLPAVSKRTENLNPNDRIELFQEEVYNEPKSYKTYKQVGISKED